MGNKHLSTLCEWIKDNFSIPMWKLSVLSFLCICAPVVLHAQIYLSGDVSGTLIDTTYIVTDDIYVSEANDLVIHSGARLFFQEGTGLTVEGLLHADGEEGDSIYFGPLDSSQRWDGIHFNRLTRSRSRIKYAIIENCTNYGIRCTGESFGITVENSIIDNTEGDGILLWETLTDSITNVVLSNNQGCGLFALASTIFINDCEFNFNGTGIRFTDGGDKYIRNSVFCNNEITGICGISQYSISVDGCSFINNQEQILSMEYCFYTWLRNCLFINNDISRDGGIYVDAVCGYIQDCTIDNNYFDSTAIVLYGGIGGNSSLLNTSITGNTYGSLIRANSFTDPTIIEHNCFYQNSNLIGQGLEDGFGIQNEINANGDPCDLFQNIFLDPLYNDPSNGDYTLRNQSPNIDAGVPDSLFDPDGTIGDIGAFYFHQNDGIEERNWHGVIPEQSWMIYPNPCNSSFRIVSHDEPVTSFALYDIQGRLIERIDFNARSSYTYNLSLLCSGTYFIQLNTRTGNPGYRYVTVIK